MPCSLVCFFPWKETQRDLPKEAEQDVGRDQHEETDWIFRFIPWDEQKRERLLDWGADEGIDDGRGLRIVILMHMFSPEEIENVDDKKALAQEIEAEVAKIGEVEKVTVFENNPEGPVAVKFKEASAAEECIQVMLQSWQSRVLLHIPARR